MDVIAHGTFGTVYRAQRAEETDDAVLAEGTEERPEFKVQTGKRRTRAAKTTRTERTVSCAAS